MRTEKYGYLVLCFFFFSVWRTLQKSGLTVFLQPCLLLCKRWTTREPIKEHERVGYNCHLCVHVITWNRTLPVSLVPESGQSLNPVRWSIPELVISKVRSHSHLVLLVFYFLLDSQSTSEFKTTSVSWLQAVWLKGENTKGSFSLMGIRSFSIRIYAS